MTSWRRVASSAVKERDKKEEERQNSFKECSKEIAGRGNQERRRK